MGRFRSFGSLLAYSLTGVSAIGLALWISGPLTKKAFSQSAPPPSQINPPISDPKVAAPGAQPVPVQPAPVPNPPQTSVPQTGTQILTIIPEIKGKPKSTLNQGESKIPDLLVGIIEDYNYNSAGKRDPFTPFERSSNSTTMGPIWPLQKYDLEQLKLVGVIWEVKIPKAMILDPSGHGYVVTVNERIGRNNGYIARIREGEIVVVENILGSDGKASYVTKLMKLNPQ